MYILEWDIRQDIGQVIFMDFAPLKKEMLDIAYEADIEKEDMDLEEWKDKLNEDNEDNINEFCRLYNEHNGRGDTIYVSPIYFTFASCPKIINDKMNERMIEVARETYNKLIVLEGGNK